MVISCFGVGLLKSYNGAAVVVLLIGKADFLNNFVDVRNDALDDDARFGS